VDRPVLKGGPKKKKKIIEVSRRKFYGWRSRGKDCLQGKTGGIRRKHYEVTQRDFKREKTGNRKGACPLERGRRHEAQFHLGRGLHRQHKQKNGMRREWGRQVQAALSAEAIKGQGDSLKKNRITASGLEH